MDFKPYTIQHGLPIVIILMLGILWILWASRLPVNKERKIGWWPALVLPIMLIYDNILGMVTFTLNIATDLPLHLCRLAAFLSAYMLWKRNRNLFGILYFWILAGTLQAIITPDLQHTFPHYQYIRYWILHVGLILTVVYAIKVFSFTPGKRDLFNAIVFAQVYLIMTIPINLLLNANYGYTIEKPPIESVASYLGDWPWYILSGELIMLMIFLLLYFLPKIWRKDSSTISI